MKTQEEIEQLAELYTNKIVEVAYHNFPLVHPKETISKVITALLKEYTNQCQKDMADNWIKVEDIEKGFEQFYPNGEKCDFTAHAAAQICEVIFKNKINKQD